MPTLPLVLAASERLRLAGDFSAAAELLDGCLLSRPETPGGDYLGILLARARLALGMGALHEARLRLEEASRLIPGGSPGGRPRMIWTSLTGLQAALAGRHDDATRLLWRAASEARALGDAAHEARAWNNLAMVFVDREVWDAADGAVTYALALGPDHEYLAAALALRGLVLFGEGRIERAVALLDEAVGDSDRGVRYWVDAGVRTVRLAVLAQAGRLDEAHADLNAARAAYARLPVPAARASVEIWAGFLDLAAGEPDGARARIAQAHAPWAEGSSLLQVDIGARTAARLLARALGEPFSTVTAGGRGSIRLPADGSWLATGDGEPSLVRALAARRILLALATATLHTPSVACSAAALIEAGWPGEVIQREAALNRLYVTIHQLRRAGLSAVLVTRRDGYLIEADRVVIEG